MLNQAVIQTAINNGKYFMSNTLSTIVTQESYGEDCTILRRNFILMNKWVEILQDYLDNNFDQNGNLTTPTFECLTADQISDLISKVNLLAGCDTQPITSDWLLATGFWNDQGFWRDTATWNDTLPII